ncbi:ATP-binding cassette domain-containing protein [Intestinimonas massiliensis (ex Afouda et al. 2020)]|uniref:ATP-binding cassette domain-containing protein n=1 Tax=Intestinimonas massiliensis (ex Afouda et al. 2020) TaxID=1673721 RepID=UPI0010304A69|nr:ATP-binding cassette domain-containing protein [Intestinimonas massiliensis (ex Afouda et al. 2020)]
MSDRLLCVRDLSISFSQYGKGLKHFISTPIKSLSVEIKKGEILAIVGASGSGKSLLAHAIMDILPPNAMVKGEISYKEKVLDKKNIGALRGTEIAFIPQSVNYLDPFMKVKNQVRIGLHETKERNRQLQEALFEKYGLKKTDGELYPYQLSGGMLRRVLFATCVKQGIQLIIADEPTPGIHKEALDMVLKQLRDFADQGMGVMLITHDIISAVRIADYISVFKDGANIETAPANFFEGKGERLKEQYTRNLWLALPQNEFLRGEANGIGS